MGSRLLAASKAGLCIQINLASSSSQFKSELEINSGFYCSATNKTTPLRIVFPTNYVTFVGRHVLQVGVKQCINTDLSIGAQIIIRTSTLFILYNVIGAHPKSGCWGAAPAQPPKTEI